MVPGIMVRIRKREGDEFREEIAKLSIEAGVEEDELGEIFSHKILLALKGAEFCGFISYSEGAGNQDKILISSLGVLKPYRQEGIATLLLNRLKTLKKPIKVETSNDNIPALALYQKNGFTITKVHVGELIEHHGTELKGYQGIPVRDRIILEYS